MKAKLVKQLQFTRQKFAKGLENLPAAAAKQRLGHANSISWIVGHLANFEQGTLCETAQGITISEAVKACGFGKPATTPPLDETVEAWRKITAAADTYLNTLTDADMDDTLTRPDGKPEYKNIGTLLLRHTWHYWYHTGEIQALRQAMGHENLPQFVGRITPEATHAPNVAKRLVAAMVDGLNDHEVEGMKKYWTDDMQWYGPAGIGHKPGLRAFQEEHQRPFLHAFPDKKAFDEIRIAEGDIVAAKGYQQVTHSGDYLGIPATHKPMQIKYMDFWRAKDGKLVENWVMIDLLDFLHQAGYNVANVLKFIGSKPPDFFDSAG